MYIAQCKLIWANSCGGYTKNFSIRSNLIPSQILSRGRSVSSSLRQKVCGKMIPFNYQIVFIEFFYFSVKF